MSSSSGSKSAPSRHVGRPAKAPSQKNGKSVSNIDENAPSELTTQHVSVKVFYISGHCTVSSLFDKFTDTVNRSKAVANISICTTNPPLNDQVLKSISEQLHTDERLILSNNCFMALTQELVPFTATTIKSVGKDNLS
jgi:hypothetical protein